MGKNSQGLDRSEILRRQQQSARDRDRNRRQQTAELVDRMNQAPFPLVLQRFGRSTPTGLPKPVLPRAMGSVLPQPSDSDFKRVFDSLFNASKYSDVTIYLGKSSIPFASHQIVLGTRCPYFDDLFQSGFKEGITNEISFEKDSPHALWRVLCYIYTGDYSDEPSEALDSDGDDLELLKHPRVFALADMFRIDGLKALSCKKFEKQLEQHWISDTFPDCIREVYSTSNDVDCITIRSAVVNAVASHRKELIQKKQLQELIREVGGFAVDLVLRITKEDDRSW